MSNFKGWLENLEAELSNKIRNMRTYPFYVDRVFCSDETFYIWKKHGSDTIKREGNVTIIESAPLVPEMVSPIPVQLRYKGDWCRWYENKVIMDFFLESICDYIISLEEKIVVETLTKGATVFELQDKSFTKSNLRESISYFESQGKYADTMLVNPGQLTNLGREDGFIPFWNLPPSFVESKGKGFYGLLGQLHVYSTPGVSKSIAIIYEKKMAKVRKTPIDISFNDYENPKMLSINEALFGWLVENGVVAKVVLK